MAEKRAEGPPLDAVLHQLRKSRAHLDGLDDKISAAIRQAEVVLREHLGVRIAVLIAEDPFESRREYLTFGKQSGGWRLLIEYVEINSNGEEASRSLTPLVGASRERRLEVFATGALEALIRSANVTVQQEIEEREKALRSAERLLAALSQFPSADSDPSNTDDIPF